MRFYTVVYLLFLLTLPVAGRGQSVNLNWAYKYSFAHQSSHVRAGAPSETGGYYVLGDYLETSCFSNQMVLCKVSDQGNQIWVLELLPDSGCESESLFEMRKIGEDLCMTGNTTGQGWLVKIDSSGAIRWQQTNGAAFGSLSFGQPDQLFICSPPMTMAYSYDTTGAYQWNTPFPTVFAPSAFRSAVVSGITYVLCTAQDTAQGESTAIALFGLNGSGAIVFDTLINYQTTTDPDYPVDMGTNDNGDIFLLSQDAVSEGMFINKYSTTQGSIQFSSYLSPINTMPRSIEVDTINQFVYAHTRTADGFRIVKYDYQLNPLDTIIMDTCIVGGDVIAVSPSGYLYCAYHPYGQNRLLYVKVYDAQGNCVDSIGHLDTAHYLIPQFLQFDTLGNVFVSGLGSDPGGNCQFVLSFSSTVGLSESPMDTKLVSVYPNPASASATINTLRLSGTKNVVVYNLTGQELFSDSFTSSTYSLNTQSLASGIYIVDVTDDSGLRSSQKLIINHQ